jgi:hypothetical protein
VRAVCAAWAGCRARCLPWTGWPVRHQPSLHSEHGSKYLSRRIRPRYADSPRTARRGGVWHRLEEAQGLATGLACTAAEQAGGAEPALLDPVQPGCIVRHQ